MEATTRHAVLLSFLCITSIARVGRAEPASEDGFVATAPNGASTPFTPRARGGEGEPESGVAAEPGFPALAWSDGIDNRTAWTSYENPRSKVGAFFRRSEPATRPMCTGAVLGPRIVLTAAHCVFTTTGDLEDATFHPAHDAALGPTPMSTYTFDLVFHVKGYVTRRCFADPSQAYCLARDFALVVLDRAMPVASFGFGGQSASWSAFSSWYKVSAGYPLDWRGALARSDGCATGRQFVDGSYAEFEHGCDVTKGQSGSPIWTSTHPTLRGNIIIGVVSADSPCVAPGCRNSVPGSATRITQAVADLIHEVRAKHP